MLNNFFVRLSFRERLVLYAACFVLFALLFDRLILNQIIRKIGFYNSEIGKQEVLIKKNLRILEQKQKIEGEEKQYASFYPAQKGLSRDEEVSALLKTIENMAKDYSLKIINLKPVDSEASGVSGEYLITLECEAKVDDFINFVYNIEYSKDILRVKKFNIIPQSPESTLAKFIITISKIIVP